MPQRSLSEGTPLPGGTVNQKSSDTGDRAELWFSELLAQSGITINGSEPYDPQFHHPDLSRRIFATGSIGIGEGYMEGWWTCDSVDELASRLMRNKFTTKVVNSRTKLAFEILKARVFNYQKISRAFQVGEQHYDTGNDLFEIMLDPTMSYSCGYWKDAETLEQAQLNKLDLICRKLKLEKGMTLLDIGSGWGSLAEHAARHYGVEVTGITVSKEQANLAAERCKGLPIKFVLQDYRELEGSYDRIASVGMFEHVGLKNYGIYMEKCHSLLKDVGLFLLHTIGTNRTHGLVDPWIKKYIFPNGKLPSVKQLTEAWEPHFILEDMHSFGSDYDKTLMAWHDNFESRYHEISSSYDERFYRMWSYYLKVCAGSFRARENQLWQMVLAKFARPGRYDSPR